MAKDNNFERDIEWHNKGFGKDFDFVKNPNNGMIQNSLQCNSVMNFISSLQEISVQENLIENSIDKNLFTLSKTFCALKNGMNLGFSTSITIVFHIIFCYIFSYKIVINFFYNNEILGMFIKYLPALITIIVTIYISNLSKYAVGDYTARALKTFYIGKMFSTVIVGIIIFVSFVYLDYILGKISFNNHMLQAKAEFFNNINIIHYTTIILILISSFLPFLFYGFRKILFTSSEKSKYEEY